MSSTKFLPPFTFDVLYYLNRDQLERYSIVCRPLKNFIDRYFQSKPCRIFDYLRIREGSYALIHNCVRWHPNRDGYSVQQFLAGQKGDNEQQWDGSAYYSFAEMRPYLRPTARINRTEIFVAGDSTYTDENIEDMESIAYLWRDGNICIRNAKQDYAQIVAEDFQLILNSPTILKCQTLNMDIAHFLFKGYQALYSVKVIESWYGKVNAESWLQFLKEPGIKPLFVLGHAHRESIIHILDRLCKVFSCAVSPNAFKIIFVMQYQEPLIEFIETNKISSEKLELKKGFPTEYQDIYQNHFWQWYDTYTLERSSV